MTAADAPANVLALFHAVADRARAAGVFSEVQVRGGVLCCTAQGSAEPAEYRLLFDEGRLWVALATEHRWLSQSIEADLVHTGDKIDELVEEELIERGWEGIRPPFEHFRDDEHFYVFRSPLPLDLARADSPEVIAKALIALLAYEAAFRPLGDMEAGEDDA